MGNPEGYKNGIKTRFTTANASEMGKRGNQKRIENGPLRLCLKHLATETMYGHPPVSADQLAKVGKFFKIKPKDVTFAHVALFKQALEMAKGDPGAFNLVAAYAGEKPTEKVELTAPDFSALNAAFETEISIETGEGN